MTDGVSLLLYKDEPVLHFLYEQSLLFDDIRCASQLEKLSKKKIDVSTRARNSGSTFRAPHSHSSARRTNISFFR